MELITISETEDLKMVQVKDGENYLEYVTTYRNGWYATYGEINNLSFRSDDGIFWTKVGKGKTPNATLNKLEEMNNYFRKSK